jgi:hypothetical protein
MLRWPGGCGVFAANVDLGLCRGPANVRGEDDIPESVERGLEARSVLCGLAGEDLDGRTANAARLDGEDVASTTVPRDA